MVKARGDAVCGMLPGAKARLALWVGRVLFHVLNGKIFPGSPAFVSLSSLLVFI